ncbi:lipid-A-disaccharide synthase [Phormidium yuhuli]|uniref:lipid-A-disaccharide synthase n=1 Tax=Phormidium yuhuli TaxID=2974039 RepID=UPI0035A89F1A
MRQRIFISTGEVSGDLQGALLIEALHRRAQRQGTSLEILALGGDRMAAAGATLLAHTSGIGSVGLLESLPFLLPTLRVQRQALETLRSQPPDLVILIDYMGPNLGLGNAIKREFPQVPIIYYIAPQTWVWSPSDRDALRLVSLCDRLLAIFPEEARYFRERGATVTWVGHPLVDHLAAAPDRETARRALNLTPEDLVIALLPASRHQELKYLVPPIFQAARVLQEKFPQAKFWIPLSLEIYRDRLQQALSDVGLTAEITSDRRLERLAAADLAISKSGTVNLELALLNVPQIALYAVHPLTASFARRILGFEIEFMSPPNLVTMTSIIPELMQEEVTPENILQEALSLLCEPQRRQAMQENYGQMRQQIGEVGVCDRAAEEIFAQLRQPGPICP